MKYLNATKAPGATASVTRTFTGGQEGPYIDYGLDAMGTADEVSDLRDSYAEAVDSCAKVSLKKRLLMLSKNIKAFLRHFCC